MNRERVMQLIERLKVIDDFNMDCPFNCALGQAGKMVYGEFFGMSEQDRQFLSPTRLGARVLDLSEEERVLVGFPDLGPIGVDKLKDVTRAHTIAMLERLVETGEVRW